MGNVFVPQEEDFKKWVKEAIKEQLDLHFLQLEKPQTIPDEPLLSRKEIARFLKISLVTLTDWTKKDFPHLRENGRVYFLKSEVLAYMRSKQKSKNF